jgi:ABC-2 type transport system permease protein
VKAARVLAIARCEARQLRRDPLLLLRALGVPLTLLLVFGYGLSLDVERVPIAVLDHDRSATSREYVSTFTANRTFDLSAVARSEAELERWLRRGEVRLALIVPPRFERTLYRGLPARVQLLVDGVYTYRAEVIRSYALAAHATAASRILSARLRERSGVAPRPDAIELRTRYLYNETLRSQNTIVPGLIPVVLMMNPAVMVALCIAREKELGSIFNFLSSPTTRAEFVLGKLVPYVVIALVNAGVLALVAIALFGVPFKGSLLLYAVGSLLFVTATASIGLVVSSFARSQIGAVVIAFVVTMIPAFLYSGLMIPIPQMDPGSWLIAHLLPAMFYNRVVMAAFLKDVPTAIHLLDLAALGLFGALLIGAGIAATRKREA